MRLELTQDRGHVHVALSAVVAIEVLESEVLCLHCASGSTFYVRADEDRLVAEWARVKSIPHATQARKGGALHGPPAPRGGC